MSSSLELIQDKKWGLKMMFLFDLLFFWVVVVVVMIHPNDVMVMANTHGDSMFRRSTTTTTNNNNSNNSNHNNRNNNNDNNSNNNDHHHNNRNNSNNNNNNNNHHHNNHNNSHERRQERSIHRRRHPDAPNIDYGGNHPFEKRRKLAKQSQSQQSPKRNLEYSNFWYDSHFSQNEYLKSEWYDSHDDHKEEGSSFEWEGYRPIRIKLDVSHLPQQQVSESHNEFLTYSVLPAAIQFWTKALMVYPVRQLYVDVNHCPLAQDDPATAYYGMADTDLIIYVTAQQFCTDATLAAADSCDWDEYDRPIAGRIHFCYNQIPNIQPNGMASNDRTTSSTIETAIHEIGHILGMTSLDLPFFYDRLTGLPRSPRPLTPIDKNFQCINGRPPSSSDLYLPNNDTLREGFTSTGIRYFELTTPTVRQVARNHFNCPTMLGLRLENQPTSSKDCFGSHFEERLAWNELMSPQHNAWTIPESLSPFTLALLEDSGWYRANYSMATITPFGHGAGCDFVYQPCLSNQGQIPDYAKDYFCNTTDQSTTFACDPTHTIMATCDLFDLSKVKPSTTATLSNIPPPFQYFPNQNWGPLTSQLADFCPTYSRTVLSCNDKKPPKMFAFPQEHFGSSSDDAAAAKCFNSNYDRPLCLKYICNALDHNLQITDNTDTVLATCYQHGQKIYLPNANNNINNNFWIECPRLESICPDMFCPGNCAGNGQCLWNEKKPRCDCFSHKEEPNCNSYKVILLPKQQKEENNNDILSNHDDDDDFVMADYTNDNEQKEQQTQEGVVPSKPCEEVASESGTKLIFPPYTFLSIFSFFVIVFGCIIT